MEICVKVNDIKKCNLDKNLVIPCSLYYKESSDAPIYNINKKGETINDNIYDILLKGASIDNENLSHHGKNTKITKNTKNKKNKKNKKKETRKSKR